MEEEDWSREPSLPKNYTSLIDLEARWMKKQQEEKELLEKEKEEEQQQRRRRQQQEKENLKQLQSQQQNPLLSLLRSNKEEEKEFEEEGRRTQYKRSHEVDSRPKAYTNRSNWQDDGNAWRRSRPPVIGRQYRSHEGKQVALANGKVAKEEKMRNESELMNTEKKDSETDEVGRREAREVEVKELEEVEREGSPVVVSSTAMTDRAIKLRVQEEEAGVARNARAKSKETLRGRREESVGEIRVPVAEKKDVVEVVINPRGNLKGKAKTRGAERVGETHVPVKKKDAVEEEVEGKEVRVVRNAGNKKKGMMKARGEESVGELRESAEEDGEKDDLVVRNKKLKVKSQKERRKEGEMSTVMEVKEKKDASVVRNSRIQGNSVKRENWVKCGEVIVESKEMEVEIGTRKEKGSSASAGSECVKGEVRVGKKKVRNFPMQYRNDRRGSDGTKYKPKNCLKCGEVIVESKEMEVEIGSRKEKGSSVIAESESVKDEVGVGEKKVRNLPMQYRNDQRGIDGTKYKPKDIEGKIGAEGESLKDEDEVEVVEENVRDGVKVDPVKENENKIRVESEVWKNDDGVFEEKMRSVMQIEQRKENVNKNRVELEVLKDEVGVVEEKLSTLTIPYGNGPRDSNGIKTKQGKESESLKSEVGVFGKKLGDFAHQLNGSRGRCCMKRYSNGVHFERRNQGCLDSMRKQMKNSGGEMVWVKKEESGDGKIGGTRTSSLD